MCKDWELTLTDHRFNSRVCLIYFNYFNGSTPTQMNDFVLIYCIKIMVMVKEPDEKPAAVINQGTLEGVVQFNDH